MPRQKLLCWYPAHCWIQTSLTVLSKISFLHLLFPCKSAVKLNKREKVNRFYRQRKQKNKQTSQTKMYKTTYSSKEQTNLGEKCWKNSKEWFKKRMKYLSRIIEAIIFLFFFFSFSSFFSFGLTFIPIEEKLVEYRSGVNVLPWTPFRNHLSDKLWYASHRLWLAPSQRSSFAFASGHLFLEFQRLPLRDFLLALATSAGCRYVLSPP